MLAIILQIIFIVLFLAFFVFFLTQFFNIFFRGYAPFIATRRRVMKRIISELDLPAKAVVIELGSGRAGFLRALRKKYAQATLIGVEYSFLPLLISRIQNSFSRARLILRKQNIFKVDISQADMIYCYLNDTTMEALEKKDNEGPLRRISYFRTHPYLNERKAVINQEITGQIGFKDYLNLTGNDY